MFYQLGSEERLVWTSVFDNTSLPVPTAAEKICKKHNMITASTELSLCAATYSF
jgi:hypothetical protein